MRAPAILFGLLTLAACAKPSPPDHVFALFFTEGSAALDSQARDIVVRAAAVSKQFPALPVNVSGYADAKGPPGATADLSKARADAVYALLVANGVPATSITRSAQGTPPDSQPGVDRRRAEIDIGNE